MQLPALLVSRTHVEKFLFMLVHKNYFLCWINVLYFYSWTICTYAWKRSDDRKCWQLSAPRPNTQWHIGTRRIKRKRDRAAKGESPSPYFLSFSKYKSLQRRALMRSEVKLDFHARSGFCVSSGLSTHAKSFPLALSLPRRRRVNNALSLTH